MILLTAPLGTNTPTPTWFQAFLDKQPPPWLLYITIVIAFGTLFFRVYKFFNEKSQHKKDKLESLHDDFWIRTILLPICLSPLVTFIEEKVSEIIDLKLKSNDEKHKIYMKDFQERKRYIVNKFMVLGAVNLDLYKRVLSLIDEIEDAIAVYCYQRSIGSERCSVNHLTGIMFTKLAEILSLIKKEHQSIANHPA